MSVLEDLKAQNTALKQELDKARCRLGEMQQQFDDLAKENLDLRFDLTKLQGILEGIKICIKEGADFS